MYVENLSPKVKELVENKIIPYSVALLLSNLDKDETKDLGSEQLRMAMFFLSQRYDKKKAEEYMKKRGNEKLLAGPLFGAEWDPMEIKNHLLSLKKESYKEGYLASGWFVRMLRAISLLEDPSKARFSDAIKGSLKELGISLQEFNKSVEKHGVSIS